MNITPVVDIFQSFIMQGIIVLLPIAIVGIVVVIVIAIIMAMMQIQDQSLTFVPKTLSVIIILLILGPWMLGHMTNIINETLDKIPALIRT